MSNPSVIFVHGSVVSGGCWVPVMERLEQRRIESYAVELPFTSLDDDVRIVREAIDELGPVTVVCHSYSGIVAALAAHRAAHIVHVAARLPAVAESPQSITASWNSPGFRDSIESTPNGAFLRPDAAKWLFNRSPVSLAVAAMQRQRPFSSVIPTEPIADPAWRTVESTYVVCTDDLTVNVDQQRIRAGWVQRHVEIDCDHSPFFSAPDELAEVIAS
ncbi:MAG: alpha/beta fold hydrolase [Ilumatobacteraceae bacterium]